MLPPEFVLAVSPGDALDVLCARFPFNTSWNAPLRRLLYELPSARDCILEVQRGGEPVLVASIIDTTQNSLNAVIIELLGLVPGTPPAALGVCWDQAVRVARRAGKDAMELYTPDHAPEWGECVQAQGFMHHHQSLTLERAPDLLGAVGMPRNLRWMNLQPSQILPYFRLIEAAFANDPGMQLSEIGSFEKAAFSRKIPIRVLCSGERLIGLACVSVIEERGRRVGSLDTLARHPDWQGKGLGDLIMREASRQLQHVGCDVFRLGVTAENTPAVTLYQKHGFTQVESWTSWIKKLI